MQGAMKVKLEFTTEGVMHRLGSQELQDIRINIRSYTTALKFNNALETDDGDFNFLVSVYRREFHLQDGSVGGYDAMWKLLFGYIFDKKWYEDNLRYGANTRE